MAVQQTKFDIWWNKPETKRLLGAAYSLGAAIVILGAMFKILHFEFAGVMLGIGMSVEAFLFALGVFDQPHKEYDWEKVYDFDSELSVQKIQPQDKTVTQSRSVGLNFTETINDDDVKKLSEGIKNLTSTAEQFAGLNNVLGATDKFIKNIDGATAVTGNFIKSQETLNSAAGNLTTSYQGISSGMETVEKNTKQYATKVEEINKNLSSINSIYEIQLKNIHSQSEGLTQHTDRIHKVTGELDVILSDVQKMKNSTSTAASEIDNFKTGAVKLSKQVSDLNQVYGNMLNALN